MDYIRIRNWDRWQSYRKDRGQPPWIKLHRSLLCNIDWLSLTDEQRGQLVSIWLLAADKDGRVVADPAAIQVICRLSREPDLMLFREKGFLDFDARLASRWRHVGVTVTPQSRVDENHNPSDLPSEDLSDLLQKDPKDYVMPQAKSCFIVPLDKIVQKFNEIVQPTRPYKTGPVSKSIALLIRARWSEGMREEDFEQVARNMLREWSGNPEMAAYIRPHTLYTGKMESYLQMGAGPSGRDPAWKRELIEEMSETKKPK